MQYFTHDPYYTDPTPNSLKDGKGKSRKEIQAQNRKDYERRKIREYRAKVQPAQHEPVERTGRD